MVSGQLLPIFDILERRPTTRPVLSHPREKVEIEVPLDMAAYLVEEGFLIEVQKHL